MLPEQKKQNNEEKHRKVLFGNEMVRWEEHQLSGYRLLPQALLTDNKHNSDPMLNGKECFL